MLVHERLDLAPTNTARSMALADSLCAAPIGTAISFPRKRELHWREAAGCGRPRMESLRVSRSARVPRQLKLDGYIRVSRVGKRRGERFISPTLQRQYLVEWARWRGI